MSDKKEQKEAQKNMKDYLKSQGLNDDKSLSKSFDDYNDRGSDNLGRTSEDSSNNDPNDSCGAGD